MGFLPGGGKVIEEIVPISAIDPVTCKEKLKGVIDERGTCLVRVRLNSSDPTKAELEQIGYAGKSPVPAPSSGT